MVYLGACGIAPANRFTTSLMEVVAEDELGGGRIHWARGATDVNISQQQLRGEVRTT